MHVFFDTVWKLHIGEIPEKPRLQPHYLGTKYGGHRFKILTDEYNEAIAAIKQNALTVGNPEIITTDEVPGIAGEPYKTGEFYFWPGGYDTRYEDIKIITTIDGASFYDTTTVRLTLPEEKKNTMENMTKEQAAIKWLLDTLRPFENMEALGPLECFKIREIESLIKEPKASGSVAAPKEERTCPKCGSGKVIMFTSDDDLCQTCGATFPGVLNSPSELASLRQQLKEREEALKELLTIAERKFNGISIDDAHSYREYIALKAIIERARKLLSK